MDNFQSTDTFQHLWFQRKVSSLLTGKTNSTEGIIYSSMQEFFFGQGGF